MAAQHVSVGGSKECRDAVEKAKPVGIRTVRDAADQHDQHGPPAGEGGERDRLDAL